MNILGFVFSLLLLLTYSFAASWDLQMGSSRVRSSYLGNQRASRDLINQQVSTLYKELPYKPTEKDPNQPKKEIKPPSKPKVKPIPANGACARINLWPLIQEGRSEHPRLYQLVCQLLDTFYGDLLTGSSSQFLDRFLKSAKVCLKDPDPLEVEKVFLAQEADRLIYYRMLKGVKGEYPSIVDYIKIDPNWAEKLCLSHADPKLCEILFGPQVGQRLYKLLHKPKPPVLSPALIDQICSEVHAIAPDLVSLYDLLLFGKPTHGKTIKMSLEASDVASQVSVKAQVCFPTNY